MSKETLSFQKYISIEPDGRQVWVIELCVFGGTKSRCTKIARLDTKVFPEAESIDKIIECLKEII